MTVGVIENGAASITVYGKDGVVLPLKEYEYEIGSLTKTFTTALLCKAISEGKAGLDDSIDRYLSLPQKEYYPTLRRLVTHTSGYKSTYLCGQMASNWLHGEKNPFYHVDRDQMISQISKVNLRDQDYPFVYSNFGMSVIGLVLEQIYGGDYASLLQTFIQSECKLAHTRIGDGTGDLSGYWSWGKTDAYLSAGCIVSTISDMLQFVRLQLDNALPYLAPGHKLLATVNASTAQNKKMGINVDAMATGWVIDAENNIFWHNGGTSNFNSYLGFDPVRKIAVVILANLPPDDRIPSTVFGAKLMRLMQAAS